MPGMATTRDIYTVARLNRAVRSLLEGHFGAVWVEGEVSNLARPASGHLYFSLKDPGAQVRCAMFRSQNQKLGFALADGMHVLAYARVGMYEPRGEFQLVVEHLEPAGEGMLRLKLEALKRKLADAGLFDPAHKQPLPVWPDCIGVVTSPSGAAVRDILQVLKRRNPGLPVILYPSAVQGAGAVPELVAAMAAANRRAECDVLILARGGGSLEDLWAFNDEAVVRAIFDSRIPIVSGVGHEIDFTLSDLVADVRAPTPSAAAELCSPDASEALRQFATRAERLTKATIVRLARLAERHQDLARRLIHPGRRIEDHHQRLDELSRRLPQAIQLKLALNGAALRTARAHLAGSSPRRRVAMFRERVLNQAQRLQTALPAQLQRYAARLDTAAQTLRAVSPAATLERGYAIVTTETGAIARRASELEPGARVRAQLAHGRLDCRVERIEPGSNPGG